ncbi:MAG TPA: DcaP family trimeric outer membrane transporter [Candidatus Udaeobacter sp.]|nr:DcaP family trimeric outer membrane transporter [Candidatus Udaeobacter sp.]
MTKNTKRSVAINLTVFAWLSLMTPLQASEVDELKATMQAMQKSMEQMQARIAELERENHKQKQQATGSRSASHSVAVAPPAARPASAAPDGNQVVTIAPTAVTIEGRASEIKDRPAIDDQQEAAPRPNDLTLDPKYRGFVPIPNTPVLIKFNAKPRVDFTNDPQNTGNPDRFVTAQIPVDGDFFQGGGNQFNVNAKGSQLSLDVRAPELPGSPRFFYQNDFFGSGGGELPFRVRQLYGQIYNVVLGQTFSVFEDPDAWPDTVDYEGPNSAIFARRPLVRYMLPLNKKWQLNFGLEKPGSEVDTSTDPDAQQVNHAPDGGLNVRWEDSKYGHVQLGAIFRDIGVKGPVVGNQNTFGWGVNLSSSLNVFDRDSLQTQLTYGQGLFRYFNDDFQNNDAAFDSSGNLTAIPAFGAMIGYTHKWTDFLRSTASYGYVHLDNQFSQQPDAYHQTHYASLNLVWQARKRLTLGLEGLYGHKEEKDGADGDAFRIQLGVLYSIFD